MLKNGNVSRALSCSGIAAVFGLGACLLPIAPTVGQVVGNIAPAAKETAPEKPAALATEVPDQELVVEGQTVSVFEHDPADANANDAKAELKKARKQIAELSRRLEEAEARIAVLSARAGASNADGQHINALPGRWEVGAAPDGSVRKRFPVDRNLTNVVPGVKEDGSYRVVITDPATGRIKEIQTRRVDEKSDTASRLDRIESEVQRLLAEIHSIRDESSHSLPETTPRRQ